MSNDSDRKLDITVEITKDSNGYQFGFTPIDPNNKPYVSPNGDLNLVPIKQGVKIGFVIKTDLDGVKFEKDEDGLWLGPAGRCPGSRYSGGEFVKIKTSEKKQRLDVRDKNGDWAQYSYALRFLHGDVPFMCDPEVKNGGPSYVKGERPTIFDALESLTIHGPITITFKK